MFVFSEVAVQDAAECSVDIGAVPWRLHQGGAATVCGHSLRAHHPAHGHPQLCECLFGLPVILSQLLSFIFYFHHKSILHCFCLSVLHPGKQLHVSDYQQNSAGGSQTLHCACK